jgi:hypothetical protein
VGPEFSLEDWFEAHELERCLECGARKAIRTPVGGYLICLDCGLFDPDGKRIGDLGGAAARISESDPGGGERRRGLS